MKVHSVALGCGGRENYHAITLTSGEAYLQRDEPSSPMDSPLTFTEKLIRALCEAVAERDVKTNQGRAVCSLLLAVASAAYSLADSACEEEGTFAVDENDFDCLSSALEALDTLPEPGPIESFEISGPLRMTIRSLTRESKIKSAKRALLDALKTLVCPELPARHALNLTIIGKGMMWSRDLDKAAHDLANLVTETFAREGLNNPAYDDLT